MTNLLLLFLRADVTASYLGFLNILLSRLHLLRKRALRAGASIHDETLVADEVLQVVRGFAIVHHHSSHSCLCIKIDRLGLVHLDLRSHLATVLALPLKVLAWRVIACRVLANSIQAYLL